MDRKRNIEQRMKRLASALLIAFGAFALHADDKTTTAATATQPPVQNDSPLVRAAKAAQAKTALKSKKKIVITNETLAKSGGHITTSNSAQPPLPALPKADPNVTEMDRQKQVAAQQAAAEKTKKALDDKKKREDAARANAVLEGDDETMGLADPAMVEKHAETAAQAQPQQPPTLQTQKPPQSN